MEQGDLEAQFRLAYYYLLYNFDEEPKTRAAMEDLLRVAANGEWTGAKDPGLAVQWYRRAAERGHCDAQYNLGFMYVLGEGVIAEPSSWAAARRRRIFTAMAFIGILDNNTLKFDNGSRLI